MKFYVCLMDGTFVVKSLATCLTHEEAQKKKDSNKAYAFALGYQIGILEVDYE